METLQRRFALIRRYVLGVSSLVLTMTFGSMSAHATLVSYNLSYSPTNFAVGTTSLDVNIFVDDTTIPPAGTADVLLSSVNVFFDSSFVAGVDPNFTYTNTDTSPCSFSCGTLIFHEPFTGEFINGDFTGVLLGAQPGPFGIGIARLSFSVTTNARIVYFGALQFHDHFNGDEDVARLDTFSGPFAVAPVSAVPLPAALPLFGSALAMLGIVGWRRKRRGDA